jgi:hypothetical protein
MSRCFMIHLKGGVEFPPLVNESVRSGSTLSIALLAETNSCEPCRETYTAVAANDDSLSALADASMLYLAVLRDGMRSVCGYEAQPGESALYERMGDADEHMPRPLRDLLGSLPATANRIEVLAGLQRFDRQEKALMWLAMINVICGYIILSEHIPAIHAELRARKNARRRTV